MPRAMLGKGSHDVPPASPHKHHEPLSPPRSSPSQKSSEQPGSISLMLDADVIPLYSPVVTWRHLQALMNPGWAERVARGGWRVAQLHMACAEPWYQPSFSPPSSMVLHSNPRPQAARLPGLQPRVGD